MNAKKLAPTKSSAAEPDPVRFPKVTAPEIGKLLEDFRRLIGRVDGVYADMQRKGFNESLTIEGFGRTELAKEMITTFAARLIEAYDVYQNNKPLPEFVPDSIPETVPESTKNTRKS